MEIDYDEPMRLQALFKGEEEGNQTKEYIQTIAILWMDIVELRNYPYEDEAYWEVHTGPKFYVTSRETGTYLVSGEFKDFYKLWKAYCKEYYGKDNNG
jgi:hypothetical protein